MYAAFATFLKFLCRKSNQIQSKFIQLRSNQHRSIRPWPINGNTLYYNYKSITPLVPLFSYVPFLSKNSTNLDLQNDVEENILHLMTLAQIALSKGDADRAENILLLSLKISEEYENYFAIPYIYDILAAIAFGQRNYTKCENLLVEGIERLLQIGVPEDNNRMIDFKLRLARIASANKEKELSEIGFKSCLNKQQNKIIKGDTSTETGMLYINVLYWYGYHKLRNEEYEAAREFVETAYTFSQKIKSLSAYQEMVILYTIADLYVKLEDYKLALYNMQNALLLAKGIGSADLPSCYLKMAKIYINLGAIENAALSAAEGLKLAELFNEKDIYEESKLILDEIKKVKKK